MEKLRQIPYALVVADHDLIDMTGEDFLTRSRASYRREVIFCCGRESQSQGALARLVRVLRVARVLFYPIDPEEMCRQVALLLGLRVPAVSLTLEAQPESAALLNKVWSKFEETNKERMAHLRQAAESASRGQLSPLARRQAEREAHQLAGSMGTFGLPTASLLARELETGFAGSLPVSVEQGLRMSGLVLRLESEFLQHDPAVVPASSGPGDRVVLVVSDEGPLLTDLVSLKGQLRINITPLPSDVRQVMSTVSIGGVIVDLPDDEQLIEERMALLQELSARSPHLVLVAIIPEDTLQWRVRASEGHERIVLARPVTAVQVMEALESRLSTIQAESRILAVDDDPMVLACLESLLQPLKYQLTTLSDPLDFWEKLEVVAPDLLILDIDMPHVSGVELCRAVRSDPRWADLPIMFLSSYNDSSVVHRIFQAGADDFVFKPVVGPELLTRIGNRLARTQVYRTAADTDALTGAMTRGRGSLAIRHHLAMASRRGQIVSLALIDLDRFKQINDRHGHAVGDEVLRRAARLLCESVRGEDLVVRWGGEEFVVALYTMPRSGASKRLQSVLTRLSQQYFAGADQEPFQVTFSAGVAEFPHDGLDLSSLVEVADQALYTAKAEGRNRIVLAGAANGSCPRSADLVLVEDDHPLAEAIIGAAESRGYRIECFSSAEVALSALTGPEAQLRGRVLVVDQNLPQMSGLEMLRQLQPLIPRQRVVLLSGQMQEAQVLEGLDLGAVDYVPKPFILSALMRKLEYLLLSA
ncbi:MAG: hypothetical protein AMXMBFR33_12120 [Candidatus Xenobia bacterium]